MTCEFLTLATGVDKLENGFGGKGNWICLKCFYGHEAVEAGETISPYGEFFLNINPKIGVLEIACKDTYYADELVAAFRKAMESFE